MNEVKLSIICCTYNHEHYIRQCLEGFVMQKPNFRFEVLVHDDASTDGTTAIIREFEQKYPNIIKPIYQQENQYSKGVDIFFQIMIPQTRGKYIAICEGDDYWIDPHKLQKQVDFLEANPEYGMCYTQCLRFYQRTQSYAKRPQGIQTEATASLIKQNGIPTGTVVIRRSLLQHYQEERYHLLAHLSIGDLPIWLWISIHSRIKFLKMTTSVYRVLDESASHSKSPDRMKSHIEDSFAIRRIYNSHYHLHLDKLIDFEHALAKMRCYASFGQHSRFFKEWRNAICLNKVKGLTYYKIYAYMIFLYMQMLRNTR